MSRVEERIVGNYVLGSLIGKGATSEVYAAEHRFLGDQVAIKLLRDELASDDAVVSAFVAEAARTREIDHPAVVRVLDFGRDEASGRCYLVMERIAGGSLAARLRDEGRLDEPTVRRLGAAIADGMQAAHARGIIHRDLKPGNIMLRGDAPAIIDFGIAKHLGQLAAVVTSRRIGTLAYMAPEQLTGGLISPAVDVWALGVILFEAVTGRLPFDNFSDGRWAQLFDAAPRAASLAPISPALDAIIARCLAREPGARFSSMAELALALRADASAGAGLGEGDDRFTQDLDGGPLAGIQVPHAAAGGWAASVAAGGWAASAPPSADVFVAPSPSASVPPGSEHRPGAVDGRRRAPAWLAKAGIGVALALVVLVAIVAASTRGAQGELELEREAVTSAAERGREASPEPVTEPATEPVTEPATEPVTEPVTEPAGDTTSEPGTASDAEPATEPDAVPDTDAALAEEIELPPTTVSSSSEPALAEVVVRSTPRGADVLVDGKRRGRTPARLEVRTPTTIVVRRSGYRIARVRVEEPGTVHVPLVRDRRTGRPATTQGETLD